MLPVFSPAVSSLQRRLRGPARLADIAARSVELAPGEMESHPGAIFIEEELTRIIGYTELSNIEEERARIRPRKAWRRPTVMHRLEDVVLSGGDLYKQACKLVVKSGERRWLTKVPTHMDDGGVFTSSWLGGLYFGHWLSDDVALQILGRDFGICTQLAQSQTEHQAAYSTLFGLSPALLPDFCRIRELTYIDTDLCSSFKDRAWAEMTARIGARYPREPHIGCMLLRGASGAARRLVNELEIAERLRCRGFTIVDPGTASLHEVLAATSHSRIIVGVEGSQLGHGVHALRRNGAMIVLQPPFRFGLMQKERCDRKGCVYAFCVGQPVTDGFTVDADSVERVLDRVLAELRSRD